MSRPALWRCSAAFLLIWSGCSSPNTFAPPPPPEVTVANPVVSTVTKALEATGNTESYEEVELRARVKGFLQSSDYVEGAMVKKGQLLFVIDPRPFQAELDAAKASLKVAKAQHASAVAAHKQSKTQAENDLSQYERSKRAAERGGVTEAELDELRTRYNNSLSGIDVALASISGADAQITAAEAMVQQAQLNFDYTQVTSPIDGRVGLKEVDVGNLVGAGDSTLLTTVVRQDPIYAIFTISETDYMRFARKAQKKGELRSANTGTKSDRVVRLGLIDEQGCPHEGTFNYADLGLDQATGTYRLRAEFPNADGLIPSGASVRIEVPQEPRPGLLIPDTAIGRDQNGAYVAMVDAENTVSIKHITTGPLQDGMRVVLEGLKPEDRIVVNGIQKARPGSKVNAKEQGGEGKGEGSAS